MEKKKNKDGMDYVSKFLPNSEGGKVDGGKRMTLEERVKEQIKEKIKENKKES